MFPEWLDGFCLACMFLKDWLNVVYQFLLEGAGENNPENGAESWHNSELLTDNSHILTLEFII